MAEKDYDFSGLEDIAAQEAEPIASPSVPEVSPAQEYDFSGLDEIASEPEETGAGKALLVGAEKGLTNVLGLKPENLSFIEQLAAKWELQKQADKGYIPQEEATIAKQEFDSEEMKKKIQQDIRAEHAKVAEERPYLYGTGELGAALVTGGATAIPLKAAGLGATAINMAQGGLYGLGASEAETLGGKLGDVAKGVAGAGIVGKALPATFTAGKSTVGKMIQRPLAGAATGAGIGLAASSGDITTEQGREDVLSSAKTGAVVGGLAGLVPGAAALLPAVAGKTGRAKFEFYRKAGEAGRSLEQYSDDVAKQNLETIKTVTEPVAEAKKQLTKQVDDMTTATTSKIEKANKAAVEAEKQANIQLKKDIDTMYELDKKMASSTKAEEIALYKDEYLDTVKRIQNTIQKSKSNLGDQLDNLYADIDTIIKDSKSVASKKGLALDFNIEDLQLKTMDELTMLGSQAPEIAPVINRMVDDIAKFPSRLESAKQISSFKQLMAPYLGSNEPKVRYAASKAYGKIVDSFDTFLRDTLKVTDKADQIQSVNRKFVGAYFLEDTIGKTERINAIQLANKKGYNTLQKLAKSEEPIDREQLQALLEVADTLPGKEGDMLRQAIKQQQAIKGLEAAEFPTKQEYVSKKMMDMPSVEETKLLSQAELKQQAQRELQQTPEFVQAQKSLSPINQFEEVLGELREFTPEQVELVNTKLLSALTKAANTGSEEAIQNLNVVKNTIAKVTNNPEKTDALMEKLAQVSENMQAKKTLTYKDGRFIVTPSGITTWAGLDPIIGGVGEKVGQVQRIGKQVLEGTAEKLRATSKQTVGLAKKLDNDTISKWAQQVDEKIQSPELADHAKRLLKEAYGTVDPTKKAAYIYMFKQTPQYRQIADEENRENNE